MPTPALRPFVRQLWISESAAQPAAAREHALPTGEMHLVFRLSGPALRLFSGADDQVGSIVCGPVVGGPRSSFYIKESGASVLSVGVQLMPGAAMGLFGVSAAELAERHTPLSDLWGADADSVLNQLGGADDARNRLKILEGLLVQRLPMPRAMHPAVSQLLQASGNGVRIDAVVRESRYSHRGFIALFRQATGISPKRYARLMRFRTLLAALHASSETPLGELALEAGYSDQAHMNREFREFAGVTPLRYRLLAPAMANHVPLLFHQK